MPTIKVQSNNYKTITGEMQILTNQLCILEALKGYVGCSNIELYKKINECINGTEIMLGGNLI